MSRRRRAGAGARSAVSGGRRATSRRRRWGGGEAVGAAWRRRAGDGVVARRPGPGSAPAGRIGRRRVRTAGAALVGFGHVPSLTCLWAAVTPWCHPGTRWCPPTPSASPPPPAAWAPRPAAGASAVPGFRSPPRLPGVDRSIRRRPDGAAVVAVRVHGRSIEAVVTDMVEGVLAANRAGRRARRRSTAGRCWRPSWGRRRHRRRDDPPDRRRGGRRASAGSPSTSTAT